MTILNHALIITLIITFFTLFFIAGSIMTSLGIIKTADNRRPRTNLIALLLVAIVTVASFLSLGFGSYNYVKKVIVTTMMERPFETKKIVLLNKGENLLLVAQRNNNIEIGYFDVTNNQLLNSLTLPIDYLDVSVSMYTLDNSTIYLHYRNDHYDSKSGRQVDNNTLLKIDIPTFTQTGQVEKIVDGLDDFWFYYPDSTHNYAYFAYLDDTIFHVETIRPHGQTEQITLPFDEIGTFTHKWYSDIVHEVNGKRYLFCSENMQFTENAVECPLSTSAKYIYEGSQIKQKDIETDTYFPILPDFAVENTNSIILHRPDEFLFVTRKNYLVDAFLTYVSDDAQWQINIGKDQDLSYNADITYDGETLCYRNSKYGEQYPTANIVGTCMNLQSQQIEFQLKSEQLTELENIYQKQKNYNNFFKKLPFMGSFFLRLKK